MFDRARHVHTETIPIRWGDMDAMGHVNNTVYFQYMEQARIGFFATAGLGDGSGGAPGTGPVVVTTTCNFRRAIVYPGTVEIRVYITALGRSSVTFGYEMRPSYDSGSVYADGTSKGVWIDIARQKSIPLPAAVRSLGEGAASNN